MTSRTWHISEAEIKSKRVKLRDEKMGRTLGLLARVRNLRHGMQRTMKSYVSVIFKLSLVIQQQKIQIDQLKSCIRRKIPNP